MATSVKQMLEAANAAVPKITPDQASDMIQKGNTLVLDVRDAPEVAASGKVNLSGFLGEYKITMNEKTRALQIPRAA